MNLCNGGSGCCGSGMHTPGTNGEYLGLDGEILFRNIWDWLVKYGLNWIIWEYVLYCLVTLRWSRIHRLWPKGWHVREVAILGPDLQGCFIFRSFQVYLIFLMMELPWISQSPPYIYVHGDFLLINITTLGFLNSCVNWCQLLHSWSDDSPRGQKGETGDTRIQKRARLPRPVHQRRVRGTNLWGKEVLMGTGFGCQ